VFKLQLVATITHQSHLCPFPLTKEPIAWNYDHSLHLYPTPHTVLLILELFLFAFFIFIFYSTIFVYFTSQYLEKPFMMWWHDSNIFFITHPGKNVPRLILLLWLQIVLGDRSPQKAFKYTGITCFNTGSFSMDSTFVVYRPCNQEVELSSLWTEYDSFWLSYSNYQHVKHSAFAGIAAFSSSECWSHSYSCFMYLNDDVKIVSIVGMF
jgi:hypothetical protein